MQSNCNWHTRTKRQALPVTLQSGRATDRARRRTYRARRPWTPTWSACVHVWPLWQASGKHSTNALRSKTLNHLRQSLRRPDGFVTRIRIQMVLQGCHYCPAK
jgi:hypothetical protein